MSQHRHRHPPNHHHHHHHQLLYGLHLAVHTLMLNYQTIIKMTWGWDQREWNTLNRPIDWMEQTTPVAAAAGAHLVVVQRQSLPAEPEQLGGDAHLRGDEGGPDVQVVLDRLRDQLAVPSVVARGGTHGRVMQQL